MNALQFDIKYYESCSECDGLDLAIRNPRIDNGNQYFTVVCRDCGAVWEDFNEGHIA